jgi:hypothetical protein
MSCGPKAQPQRCKTLFNSVWSGITYRGVRCLDGAALEHKRTLVFSVRVELYLPICVQDHLIFMSISIPEDC